MAFIKPLKDLSFKGNTTRGLDLGAPEGEADINKPFYEDFLSINDAIARGKFIISGRKGVGKSAFVKNLIDQSSLDNELLSSVIKGKDVLLTKLIHSIPDEVGNCYSIIYEWIVLIYFVQLILKNDEAKYTHEYKALQGFLQKNSGIAQIDSWLIAEVNEEKGWNANFSSLVSVLPASIKKGLNLKLLRAPFYALLPALRSVVIKILSYDVCKELNFIVMFDDLDEDFHLNNRMDRERLMELLRLTRRYNTEYLTNRNHRVIVLVRDDIVRQVIGDSGNDTSKLFASYEYRLNWYHSDTVQEESELLLRKFINKRISICFKSAGLNLISNDPWTLLVDNSPKPEYREKTAFKFILDHTFYKPRDLIYFFKDIDTKNYSIPMDSDAVKNQLEVFAQWNMTEIEDEIDVLYNDTEIKTNIKKIFKVISDSADGLSYKQIIEEMKRNNLDESVFETLVKYNYIVPKDLRGNQYFSYREDAMVETKDKYNYVLPKAIYIYYQPQTILQRKKFIKRK